MDEASFGYDYGESELLDLRIPVSIVMPAKEEAEAIPAVIAEFFNVASMDWELIVVVDNVADPTRAVVSAVEDPRVKVVVADHSGIPGALRTGFDQARNPLVVVAMADGSDDLSQIEEMVKLASDQRTVVVASRYLSKATTAKVPLVQGALSRMTGWILHKVGALPIHDATNSFRLYPRWFLRETKLETSAGFGVSLELIVKASRRVNIVEVPTQWRGRVSGRSKFRLLAWLPGYLRWAISALWHRVRRGYPR